jgi:uridine phosphorylase
LRPEYVKGYPKPLSSDAFSAFGKLDREIHNKEVEEATNRLQLHAKELSKNLEAMESTALIHFLHSKGFFSLSLFVLSVHNDSHQTQHRNQSEIPWNHLL